MSSMFTRATREQSRLRMALIGPAGSGKTYTALAVASGLGERIAVLDTEHGSASKYSGIFEFDSFAPDSFEPEVYMDAIREAGRAGYDVLVLDSLSHAWAGKGGLLEFVDEQARRSRSGNSFAAWREATPKHNQLIESMLSAPLHLIVTMRAKTEYVMDYDERTKKTTPRKVGLQPVQRDGLEYEFDVVGDLTHEQDLIISKTRCPDLTGRVYRHAGEDLAGTLREWLGAGTAPQERQPEPQVAQEPKRKQRRAGATPGPQRTDEATRRRLYAEVERLRSAVAKADLEAGIVSLLAMRKTAEADGLIHPDSQTYGAVTAALNEARERRRMAIEEAAGYADDDPFSDDPREPEEEAS